MKIKELLEGIRFGQKEINELWQNPDDVLIGFEYEFHLREEFIGDGEEIDPDDYGIEDLIAFTEEEIEERGITNIENVVKDTSVEFGVEVITKPMNLIDAFNNIEDMFQLIYDIGSTSDSTGLHINISFPYSEKFTFDNINLLKLLLLLDESYIRSFFSFRINVSDVIYKLYQQQAFEDIIEQYELDGLYGVSEYLNEYLKNNMNSNTGINAKYLKGSPEERRIEIRYPGGEDYEEHYNEITWHMQRFIVALKCAFEPDFMMKDYYKSLSKLLNKISKKVDSEYDFLDRIKK